MAPAVSASQSKKSAPLRPGVESWCHSSEAPKSDANTSAKANTTHSDRTPLRRTARLRQKPPTRNAPAWHPLSKNGSGKTYGASAAPEHAESA